MIERRLGIMRRFLRGGRARVRYGRVRWRKGLFVVSRFVCVEGPVVVRRSLAMVPHGRPVIRHPSEILLVVILRPELVGSSALGVVVVPAERKRVDGGQLPKEKGTEGRDLVGTVRWGDGWTGCSYRSFPTLTILRKLVQGGCVHCCKPLPASLRGTTITCRNNPGGLCGLGHCCTVRTASCGRGYLVCSSQSCGVGLHEIAGPHSGGPCTSAARIGDASPRPTSGCCCHCS